MPLGDLVLRNGHDAVWPERLVVLRRPAPGAAPVVEHVQRSDARGGGALWTDEAESWLTRDGDNFAGVIWNYTIPDQKESNRPYFTKVHPATNLAPVDLKLSSLKPGSYRLRVYRTGYKANDPYTQYMEWGRPDKLTSDQISTLQGLTSDAPEIDQTVKVGADGGMRRSIPLRSNDVLLVKLERAGS